MYERVYKHTVEENLVSTRKEASYYALLVQPNPLYVPVISEF